MILVLAGTADGRKLAANIQAMGYPVLVSTATEYGGTLVDGIPVRSGILDQAGFQDLFKGENIRLVVDASHPYATNVSSTVMTACNEARIHYIRYERPSASLPDSPLIHRVTSFQEGAEKCGELGDCIFLGTGSNNLSSFTTAPGLEGKKLVARVLPTPEIVSKCLEQGLSPTSIVAMQGPFGVELNQALYRHYGVQVVVSKESGDEGGTDAKVQAALELGIPVVLIVRPQLDYPAMVTDWPGLKKYLEGVVINIWG
jgi:precorrin-6A/cobalt-precorrin-6A reductase